jgi:hypothetical protein
MNGDYINSWLIWRFFTMQAVLINCLRVYYIGMCDVSKQMFVENSFTLSLSSSTLVVVVLSKDFLFFER